MSIHLRTLNLGNPRIPIHSSKITRNMWAACIWAEAIRRSAAWLYNDQCLHVQTTSHSVNIRSEDLQYNTGHLSASIVLKKVCVSAHDKFALQIVCPSLLVRKQIDTQHSTRSTVLSPRDWLFGILKSTGISSDWPHGTIQGRYTVSHGFNPIHPIGNSLKKQKPCTEVALKPPYKIP